MISLNAALARIRRQKIEEFSGSSFVSREAIRSEMPYLETYNDQQFLFGIYASEQKWTVLSVNYLFAMYEGTFSYLQLDLETRKVFEHFRNNNFSIDLDLGDGRKVWFKSEELCSLILNIMLMLEKVPCGTILEK